MPRKQPPAPTSFRLEISIGNDEMSAVGDIAEVVLDLAHELRRLHGSSGGRLTPMRGSLRDLNGNRVGGWEIA